MKLAFALISALILMDYAAATPWKHFSSYVPNKASLELDHEQVQELEGYLEADQKQNIQSNPDNDHELQQQSKQRKIYDPTAAMSDKRRRRDVYVLYVDPMTTGAVEAVFKSPTENSNMLRLFNAENDYILYVGLSFNSQTMSLNTYTSDGWGEWVYPEGFPFPCCEYVTLITLRVDIAPKDFIVSVNGLELATFPFRPGLGPPVEKVTFTVQHTDAELISLMVVY